MMQWQADMPEGQVGEWRVERYTVTPDEAQHDRMMAMIKGRQRCVPAGTYTRLVRGGTLVMSDTPDEARDHREAVRRATGECLVFGLGLGLVVEAMLQRREVWGVTVVERASEVIALVAPTLQARWGTRLVVIEGDALTYRMAREAGRGPHFGVVWADIWDAICVENLPSMAALRRYWCPRAGWMDCWCRGECQRLQRAWRREQRRYQGFFSTRRASC
jgi:hypothetical protein